jgi:threonine dehydrogenase-like Zn-dependent dehydrogenase
MLIYRGQTPEDLPIDDTIDALAGNFTFPLRYGYALVGEVTAAGPQTDPAWLGRRVFAFHPHESCFNTPTANLIQVPVTIQPEDAIFLPTLETAVNFVMDGRPVIGEQVVVFGQGIVGLLTTALLAHFPLAILVTLDRYAIRRRVSQAIGANLCLDPAGPGALETLRQSLGAHERYAGADLVYELSGAPETLNQAIAATGFGGRIVVGSWYGQKRAALDLGGRFHRARLQIISSQVSSLSPYLAPRWSKSRRLATAWEALESIRPAQFITHRFPVQRAAEAYHLLDSSPERAIQVIFTH